MKTVLIVDDIKNIRDGIAFILSETSHNILEAQNGLEAIDILNTTDINLVITDILMPEMDGIEFVRRAKEEFPSVQFILVSGGGRQLASAGDYSYLETAGKLTGIDTILKKPFKPEELLTAVNEKLQA
jgi:YesN/AraC family two-component response regulator